MSVRSQLVNVLRPVVKDHPTVKNVLAEADRRMDLASHSAAAVFPILVRPQTRRITVAITAYCNLRCVGCRYGRDFMPGHQMSLSMVRDLLDDASRLGVDTVRLYGGEPLLHPDLPEMVRHARKVGIDPYVTTNGVLLKHRIDALYESGLRSFTIGFYGIGDDYDQYVQRPRRFAEVEAGIAAVRERYSHQEVDLQLNFLLMRPSCSVDAVRAAWEFAERYDMTFRVDLIHYSLPYFTEGPDRQLQIRPEDEPNVRAAVDELLRLKERSPERFRESAMGIRSIPDWLLKGSDMRVPCDAYKMIWIGADGTVQLCYVTFKLGNLHEKRLADILYGEEHRHAARDAFALNCPNCHCERDSRIQKHARSRAQYAS